MRKSIQKRLVRPRSKLLSAKVLRGKQGRARKAEPAVRKQAIFDAALDVFAECGFEAARLDDVAARAGVAKGTLYLHFDDKEALFEEVVRSAVSPIIERLDALAAAPDLPTDKILDPFFAVFEKEVLGQSANSCSGSSSPRARDFRASPNSIIAMSSRASCR